MRKKQSKSHIVSDFIKLIYNLRKYGSYCLLNLSSVLVLFTNPGIYARSSPLTCKDSFLIVLKIANSTSKTIYNQIRSFKPLQVSLKNCVRQLHKRMK